MYAENGAAMRRELAALLRQHRIQQRIGGTTREEREEHGVLVRQYRQTILVWLSQAMRAATPLAFSNMPPAQPNPFRSVGTADSLYPAAGELARVIDHTMAASTARPASTDTLATPHGNPVIEHWRLAARAAVLAEHDTSEEFAAQMTAQQAQALVGDVAALSQAIIVLDRRYKNTPGMGATRAGRTPRMGVAGSRPRRQPRAARLHRRPPRLAPQGHGHPRPRQARHPRRPTSSAQPRRPDGVGTDRDEPATHRRLPAPRLRPPGPARRTHRRGTRPAMDRACRDLCAPAAAAP